MKQFIASFFLLGCLVGCGDGDLGSSRSETTVISTQEQDNAQTIVPESLEADCTVSCTFSPITSTINATKNCTGAALVVVAVTSLDQCDSIIEATGSLEDEIEVE